MNRVKIQVSKNGEENNATFWITNLDDETLKIFMVELNELIRKPEYWDVKK